jgi:hypothetical protein
MNWNIFSPTRKGRKRGKAKDSFDELINAIEAFAPREHLSSREAFYYNYKMMPSCKKQLTALLETLSRKEHLKTDPHEHAGALFHQLKCFYDPKETLSIKEALSDKNLIRKFRDLFVFFYGRENLSGEEIEVWLKPLK